MLLHLVLTSVRSRESEGTRGIAMRSDSKVRSARPDVSTDDKLDRLSRDEDRKRRTGTLYRTNAYVHLVYAYMRPTMVNGSEILLESGTMAREEEVKAFFSIPGHRRRGRNRSKRMIVFLQPISTHTPSSFAVCLRVAQWRHSNEEFFLFGGFRSLNSPAYAIALTRRL